MQNGGIHTYSLTERNFGSLTLQICSGFGLRSDVNPHTDLKSRLRLGQSHYDVDQRVEAICPYYGRTRKW